MVRLHFVKEELMPYRTAGSFLQQVLIHLILYCLHNARIWLVCPTSSLFFIAHSLTLSINQSIYLSFRLSPPSLSLSLSTSLTIFLSPSLSHSLPLSLSLSPSLSLSSESVAVAMTVLLTCSAAGGGEHM